MNSKQQKRVKLSSAAIAASAAVALGAVGFAVANERAGTSTVMSGGMTLGPTTTTTTPPGAPAISVAVPTDKATPPAGFL